MTPPPSSPPNGPTHGPGAGTVFPTPGAQNYLPAQPSPGDLTDEMLATDWWTDDLVARAGIPIIDVPFVSVGGGIGSFVTVDYLRISGVPTDQIRVLSALDHPWETYEYLTRVSQVPRTERLRSDSASRPDNIWGFPSYAVSEAWQTKSLTRLWQVLVEPMFADFYTPKAGQAFATMERERDRIRYNESLAKGLVRVVRRRAGGGYFTILTPPDGATSTKRLAFRSQYVHLAVGYPGLRFLPDLQAYRTEHNDFQRVVNAYESHEHVYERLMTTPSTVLVRGGGVVASRVLQRLMDDRLLHGAQTTIVHLFRTFIDGPNDGAGNAKPNVFMKRPGSDGWAYQGFNYPKSVWGGQLKAEMRKLEGEERAAKYKVMGGTNTPYRRYWQKQLKQSRAEGWYQLAIGTVESMTPSNGRILNQLKTAQGVYPLEVDFVIDCTGLEADIAEHRLLKDLLDHGGASRNPIGRLDVDRNCELKGTASGNGAIFASGSATLGGYFPGVDTFLGLQVSAQEIQAELAKRGFGHKIGTLRSVSQWLKWFNGKQI